MTAIAIDRPRVSSGGAPARRAMLRWAWRLFRREWRQQLLSVALIIVAVGGAVVGTAIGSNAPQTASGTFGTAPNLVTLPGGDPHLASDVAALRSRFGTVDVMEASNLVTGSAKAVQIRAADPHGPYGAPMLSLLSGRYPVGAGQVAVTRQLASRYHLHVGSVWRPLLASASPLTVVGLVENPQNLLDDFALVAPGQLLHPSQVTVLFAASPGQLLSYHFPDGAKIQTRPPPAGGLTRDSIVLVLVTFSLIFIGLVSVAGFSVMGQRRLRSLGMVGSLGATDRNVRLVMLANGAVVGVVGTVGGAAVGFAVWFSYAPALQASANHVVDRLNLPWWAIATAMALAVATAVIASWWPARAVARVPVVTALSGRPDPPRPSRHTAIPGGVLLAAGLLLLAAAGPGSGATENNALLLLGLLGTVLGGLLLSPLTISGLALAARRTPVAVRLAWRDLGRYRARSGATLGAVSLAITIAALVCMVASTRAANVLDYVGPYNLAANQLLLNAPGSGPTKGVAVRAVPGAGLSPAIPAPPPPPPPVQAAATVGKIARALGQPAVLGLVPVPARMWQTGRGQFQNFNGQVVLATPALLRTYGIHVNAGTDIITSRPGFSSLGNLILFAESRVGPQASACPPATCIAHPVIQESNRLPAGTSAPNVVITEQALHRLGLQAGSPQSWIIQTSKPMTATEQSTALALAAAAGMTVDTKAATPSLSSLERWATVAGIVVALGVLAMTSGLIRSEAAGDLRTLTATGAGTRVRRLITGATAGGLGLMGGILGTAVGLAGISVFYRHHLHDVYARMPVGDLLILAIGLPLVAFAGGWLFAGREPPALAHRPLE